MHQPEIAQYLLSASAPRTAHADRHPVRHRAPATPMRPPSTTATVQLTYAELIADIEDSVAWLAARGIGRGDRIGIRMPSGSYALYVAILATLATGAAYVPVDADDPRGAGRAGVRRGRRRRRSSPSRAWSAGRARRGDGARRRRWAATTPGSSSPPARPAPPRASPSRHRNAAAFVDAEAQMFLQDNPIGPGDRVLAGLSVAFDASCEEMWLAWRHGACLVPAPRSLVRSGMDLGPWLVSRDITVVSTVPTLAALWPAEALEAVRLLIFGGEACPPELAERLAVDGPRGVEHLRPDRGDGGGVRGPAGRHGAGQHRAAAAGLGPGRRRQGRPPGARRRGRRTGHRRRRAGPLPRPGQGRREVRADADAGLGRAPTAAATWCGWNPTGCTSWAAPTTRSRSAAGASSSARSTPRW